MSDGAPSPQVLLSLPPENLRDALAQQPELREPLVSHAATHLEEVSAEKREVLGLADDEEEAIDMGI